MARKNKLTPGKKIMDGNDYLADIVNHLSPLPNIIRYDDDYSGIVRTIRTQDVGHIWELRVDGRIATINWRVMQEPVRKFVQSWLVWHLVTYDATTSIRRAEIAQQYHHLFSDFLCGLIQPANRAKEYWLNRVLGSSQKVHFLALLKSFIFFMCDSNFGEWSPSHRNFVSKWPYGSIGRKDKLHTVRSGNTFLSSSEEIALVEYYDDLNSQIRLNPASVGNKELRAACVLYWAYQHAFRPIQIASLNLPDVRVRPKQTETPIVHATFYRAKQRSQKAREPMLRSVKRDWAWMMASYHERRISNPRDFVTEPDRPYSYFGLPPMKISVAIRDLSIKLMDVQRTAADFRHSAAQRLVDSGASQIELADFLGHSDVDTGLVYFDTSPSQADRVNKALGLSPIYSTVAEIARTKSIDIDALLDLPDDQQIGATPHGILIAGIGACNVGQPVCAKNPALSCYTCSKFLPLSDSSVHESVRDELRPVVHQFAQAGRNDESNPAFMQLRRTFDAMELLISELRDL